MREDVEGQFIANLVEGSQEPPRPISRQVLLHLYTLPPNSRYSFFVGFMCILIDVFLFLGYLYRWDPSYYYELPVGIALGTLLALFCFALPLLMALRLRYAVQFGVLVPGKVVQVAIGRTTAYTTSAGMQNGAVKLLVVYSLNGQEQSYKVFLDRPWVRSLRTGSELLLLVDPKKASVLYVVSMVGSEGRQDHRKHTLFRANE